MSEEFDLAQLSGNPRINESVQQHLSRQRKQIGRTKFPPGTEFECKGCGDCCTWNFIILRSDEGLVKELRARRKYPHGSWNLEKEKFRVSMPGFYFFGNCPPPQTEFLRVTGRTWGYWVLNEKDQIIIYNPTPCIHLKTDGLCAIYHSGRPVVCGSYFCKRYPKKFNSVLFEEGDKEKLIIFFGGLGQKIGITEQPFEFVKTTRYAQYTKIFVRDSYRSWYHRGLKDVTTNIVDTIAYIKDLVKDYENIICVGNSAGGFAALLFGAELQATAVHAFSPQTFIDPKRDGRWKEAGRVVKLDTTILDVKPYLKGKTQYFIHYCQGDEHLDGLHAEHVRDVPNVHLFKYECNGDKHASAKYLRRRNLLSKIIGCETAEDVYNQIGSVSHQPPPQ